MSVVMLTGASGFLGTHILQRLLEEEHRVRALVRTPAKLSANLAALGVDPDDARLEVVTGDMTDVVKVREALTGCDRAIHAAATYSYRRSDADRMQRQNRAGTTTVLDAAIEEGCAGIVHVSSTVALLHPQGTSDHQSALGTAVGPYSESKVESERIARERQDAGAPVAIVNPGGILGPFDPYLGESNESIRDILAGRVPVWPRGSAQWVDVRDTAAVVVAALDRPGNRYLVPGTNVSLPHEPLREVTGRRLPAATVPFGAALPVLWLGYRTGLPFLPHALEGARILACNTRYDASATVTELGIKGRPLDEAMSDTVQWLVEAGHITAGQAGRCRPAS